MGFVGAVFEPGTRDQELRITNQELDANQPIVITHHEEAQIQTNRPIAIISVI